MLEKIKIILKLHFQLAIKSTAFRDFIKQLLLVFYLNRSLSKNYFHISFIQTAPYQGNLVATRNPGIYETPPASHTKAHQHTRDHQPDFVRPYVRTLISHYNRILYVPPKCHGCKCKQPDPDSMDRSVDSILPPTKSS